MTETTAITASPADINLYAWCAQLAEKFREYEHIEMAAYPTGDDRDDDIVMWVVRCLANPDCEGSAEVLEAIDRQRAVTR